MTLSNGISGLTLSPRGLADNNTFIDPDRVAVVARGVRRSVSNPNLAPMRVALGGGRLRTLGTFCRLLRLNEAHP